jgi:hypothetical protein
VSGKTWFQVQIPVDPECVRRLECPHELRRRRALRVKRHPDCELSRHEVLLVQPMPDEGKKLQDAIQSRHRTASHRGRQIRAEREGPHALAGVRRRGLSKQRDELVRAAGFQADQRLDRTLERDAGTGIVGGIWIEIRWRPVGRDRDHVRQGLVGGRVPSSLVRRCRRRGAAAGTAREM